MHSIQDMAILAKHHTCDLGPRSKPRSLRFMSPALRLELVHTHVKLQDDWCSGFGCISVRLRGRKNNNNNNKKKPEEIEIQ